MKGYKVFNPDWTCQNFQYEVGKTFEMDKAPVICQQGFHFCKKATDCFDYYSFDSRNKVAEVEALLDTITVNDYYWCQVEGDFRPIDIEQTFDYSDVEYILKRNIPRKKKYFSDDKKYSCPFCLRKVEMADRHCSYCSQHMEGVDIYE